MDENVLWRHLDGFGAGLNSNQPLPDPELVIAKQLLVLTQTKLREIIADMTSDYSPISDLVQRHNQLLERQEKLCIAVAPWKRVPLEVLGEIFVHSVDGEEGVISLPFHKPPFSWTLVHVCLTWRQVALDEPRIWDRLYINITPDNFSNTTVQAHKLIDRTKESSISLSLVSILPSYGEDIVTNLIMPYASRIKNLSLKLQQAAYLSFFQLPAGSFNSLEFLFVAFTNEHLDMLANNTLSIFDATPCLRRLEVRFNNWGHLNPSITLQLPWFQLTDVTFSGAASPPFAVIFRVLGQCTKLVNFTTSFGNNDLSFTNSSDPATLILPNLRSLTVNTVSTLVLFNRLLAPLVTPGLEAFYIYTSFGTLRWPQWPFLSLIKRSNCSIKTLSSPFLVRLGDVDSLLAVLPSLVNLSLPATSIPPATIDSIIRRGMLPTLETVAFTVDSSDAFLDLVEARRSGNDTGYKGIVKADVRALDYTGPSKDRFKKLKPEYLREGRSITVRR